MLKDMKLLTSSAMMTCHNRYRMGQIIDIENIFFSNVKPYLRKKKKNLGEK